MHSTYIQATLWARGTPLHPRATAFKEADSAPVRGTAKSISLLDHSWITPLTELSTLSPGKWGKHLHTCEKHTTVVHIFAAIVIFLVLFIIWLFCLISIFVHSTVIHIFATIVLSFIFSFVFSHVNSFVLQLFAFLLRLFFF